MNALGLHSFGEAVAVVGVVLGTAFLVTAQRRLSTPVRQLRRHTVAVEGTQRLDDGTVRPLRREDLIAPLDGALQRIDDALERRGQAVLFGPPGTGKTYHALRYAVRRLGELSADLPDVDPQAEPGTAAFAATIWSPADSWQSKAVVIAAMPVACVRHASAPSISAMRSSSIATVGFCSRE